MLLSHVAKSCLTLVNLWITAHQAPLSMDLSRQEYWSRLPFPSPGDLSNPGIKPESPALASEPVGLTRKEKKQQRLMNILSMELEFGGLSDPKR